jgi:DNA-binding transcriptional regulator YiaG
MAARHHDRGVGEAGDRRQPVTASAFRRRLAALGLSQRGFARHVGANERTVRRWIAGEQDIPPWVALVLDLMEKAR